MLIFFILCAFLRMPQGTSVPLPPDAFGRAVPTNMTILMERKPPVAPDNGDHPLRTAYSIVQSCLLTISACVWKSAHPNTNSPTDSGWACLKRRVVIMLCTVIAPELVLLWALKQYSGAKQIAKSYNDVFAKSGA